MWCTPSRPIIPAESSTVTDKHHPQGVPVTKPTPPNLILCLLGAQYTVNTASVSSRTQRGNSNKPGDHYSQPPQPEPQYNRPSIPGTRRDSRSNRKTRPCPAAEGGWGPFFPPPQLPPGAPRTAKTSSRPIPSTFKITLAHKPKFLQDPRPPDLPIPSTHSPPPPATANLSPTPAGGILAPHQPPPPPPPPSRQLGGWQKSLKTHFLCTS